MLQEILFFCITMHSFVTVNDILHSPYFSIIALIVYVNIKYVCLSCFLYFFCVRNINKVYFALSMRACSFQ